MVHGSIYSWFMKINEYSSLLKATPSHGQHKIILSSSFIIFSFRQRILSLKASFSTSFGKNPLFLSVTTNKLSCLCSLRVPKSNSWCFPIHCFHDYTKIYQTSFIMSCELVCMNQSAVPYWSEGIMFYWFCLLSHVSNLLLHYPWVQRRQYHS